MISDFDKRTVEAAVRSAVMDACWVGRGGYNIPVAEALVTKALGVIWNVLPTTTKEGEQPAPTSQGRAK